MPELCATFVFHAPARRIYSYLKTRPQSSNLQTARRLFSISMSELTHTIVQDVPNQLLAVDCPIIELGSQTRLASSRWQYEIQAQEECLTSVTIRVRWSVWVGVLGGLSGNQRLRFQMERGIYHCVAALEALSFGEVGARSELQSATVTRTSQSHLLTNSAHWLKSSQ